MTATIKDIARKANVSIATVSRVINNPLQVSDDKRSRVEDAIKELDYKPNAIARGLIKGSINTIGVIIPDINNLFYPAVIRGIEDGMEKQGYSIFLCNTDEDLEKEKKYIDTLFEKNVDGIIFMGTRPNGLKNNEHIVALSEKLPVLMINDDILGSNVYSVITDEVNGAYKAVSYLISLGHKRIAFINGDADFTTYKYKLQGYERAMSDNGKEIDRELVINETPYELGGYRGTKRLLSLLNPPTAVFAASDQIAIGAIRAISEAGLKIPGDISVIGYGDVPMASEIYPALTSVNQFPYNTGKLAAETLINICMDNKPEQRKTVMEPELSVRDSCAALDSKHI